MICGIANSRVVQKVKCDNKQPCENCVKRDHAQLCSYKPNRSGARSSLASDTASSTQGKKRPHSPDEDDVHRPAPEIKTESGSEITGEITAAYGESAHDAQVVQASEGVDSQPLASPPSRA